MPDYKTMYLHLFREVTKAVKILQAAQQKTEDFYLNSKEPRVVPFHEAKQPKK